MTAEEVEGEAGGEASGAGGGTERLSGMAEVRGWRHKREQKNLPKLKLHREISDCRSLQLNCSCEEAGEVGEAGSGVEESEGVIGTEITSMR